MTDAKFTALLRKTANAAERHMALSRLVREECMRRHGVDYGDVDADGLIEVLDLHGGEMDAAEFDETMNQALRLRAV